MVQDKIKSLDLSRNIDYGEYIFHNAHENADIDKFFEKNSEEELFLDAIPQYVFSMKSLEELNLSFQYLKVIPDEIKLLENLRELRCAENK